MNWITKIHQKIVDTKVYKWLDKFYTDHPIILDLVLLTGELTILIGLVKFVLILL